MYHCSLRSIDRKIVFGLLFLLIACSPSGEKETVREAVTLLHITDTHVMDLDGYHPALAERRQHYSHTYGALKEFFRSVPGEVQTDAVILTGDVIDFYEGETDDGTLRNRQVELFSRLYKRSPAMLLMTLGNHDITTYWSGLEEGKRATQNNSQKARAAWIRNIPCFKEGTYYSRTYRVGQRKYRLIFLDNGYRIANSVLDGLWDREQRDWLRNQLLAEENEVVILFYHIPVPIGDTNQDSIHFKLPPAGWLESEIDGDGIMDILNSYSAVVAAFTGHGHKNIIEELPLPAGHSFTQIETAAFASDPNNWRVIELREDEIVISAPGGENFEKRIPIVQ